MDGLHTDDVKLFRRVKALAEQVAEKYQLPLTAIIPHPDCTYAKSPLGDCATTGVIRLVLRGKEADGSWATEPRAEDNVWATAAHELAHLRHMNHGLQFQQFEVEMQRALENARRQERHARVEKLFKLKQQAESEAQLGNAEAAEAFAATINRLLLDWELSPTELEKREQQKDEPIVELRVNKSAFQIQATKTRVAWQETLADIVAGAHMCRTLIRPKSNDIWFVGTNTHATIAEYVFGTMVPQVEKMSLAAYLELRKALGRSKQSYKANGYRESWIAGFIDRIWQRFDEAKRAAIRQAVSEGESESMALVRIDTTKQRVTDYIDNKFKRKRRYADQLSGPKSGHNEGYAAGKSAADALQIGRKGLNSPTRGNLHE